MNINKFGTVSIILLILLCWSFISVSAGPLAPDRSQQVLDLLAVECQNISDYSLMAQYGDTSRFYIVKDHIAVTISNITILMNGYDNSAINSLWGMYNQFQPDASSAQRTAETCSNLRGEIYRKISHDSELNLQGVQITNFNDCMNAGYHVNGDTCFIGGNSVFDGKGNLIGYYYADCFDYAGYHSGSCWDCFYGADNEGCIEKP